MSLEVPVGGRAPTDVPTEPADELRSDRPTLRPGAAVDEWTVDAAIGIGGDGVVYRAHATGDPRNVVALKVYWRPSARLQREAAVLSTIDHPNIVAVRACRLDGRQPYLVLDRVDGPSLARWIEHGAMDPTRAVALFTDAVAAVAYLHVRGVHHRDVKPGNFVFDRVSGKLMLVDFGHAHGGAARTITDPEVVFATAPYAPPELGMADADEARGDVYALGVILHEMLTGAPAYPRASSRDFDGVAAVLRAKRSSPLDPGPPASDFLRELVRRATAPDPGRRFATAEEIRREIAVEIPTFPVPTPATVVRTAPRPPDGWLDRLRRWWSGW